MQKYIFTSAGFDDKLKTKVFQFRENQSPNLPLVGTLSNVSQNSKYTLKDLNGRNIVSSLTLRANGRILDIAEAVINITRRNRIVSTSIVGGTGTVKELICEDDMELDITVAISSIDDDGKISDEYPEDGVRDLIDFLDAKHLDIYSPFLTMFDIDGGDFAVVINEYTVEQETYSNRQVFKISAVSDFDNTIFYEEN